MSNSALFSLIQLRHADMDDCKKIFNWRNANEVRKASINSDIINYEQHEIWFKQILNNHAIFLLIGEMAGTSIGTLRFNVCDQMAEVSIYLVPDFIGKGYGGLLLQEGENWLKDNHPNIKQLNAKILSENVRSQKFFATNGYENYLQIFRKEL